MEPITGSVSLGSPGVCGLVGNGGISASSRAGLLLPFTRPGKVRRGWRGLSILADARKILMYGVCCFPLLIKYIFIMNPSCSRSCAWNWGTVGSTRRHAPGLLEHLLLKGRQ